MKRTTMRTLVLAVVVAIAASAAGFAPSSASAAANASSSQPVTISVTTVLSDPSDPFTSTGGIVCASGMVSTPFVHYIATQSGSHAQIVVGKHFVCSNGTFDLILQVTQSFPTFDTSGRWSVVSGTGAYAALRGVGTIIGTAIVPGVSVQDEYTGSLHIDP